jgi:hypothetical protein
MQRLGLTKPLRDRPGYRRALLGTAYGPWICMEGRWWEYIYIYKPGRIQHLSTVALIKRVEYIQSKGRISKHKATAIDIEGV